MIDDIAENDLLYKYIVRRNGPERGHGAYLEGGRSNAFQVAAAAKRLLKREPSSILEFASGYGRVTRHLRTAFPNADLVASDIHPEACSFIHEKIGVRALVSTVDPAGLSVGTGYDFIFVLSLFSHLPHKTFGAWLNALYSTLVPGGVLLFTTHGEVSKTYFHGIDLSREEAGDGWIYRRKSDQPDLDIEDYGTMIVTPRYVAAAVEGCDGARLKSFVAGAWLTHQDEWAIERPAAIKTT